MQFVNASQEAGIQATQKTVSLGAPAMPTGTVRLDSFRTLPPADICYIFGNNLEAAEKVLLEWRAHRLHEINEAPVEGHWI